MWRTCWFPTACLLYCLSFKLPEELSLDVEISVKIQRTLSPLHRQADL